MLGGPFLFPLSVVSQVLCPYMGNPSARRIVPLSSVGGVSFTHRIYTR